MWTSDKVFKDIKIFWAVYSRRFIGYQGTNFDLVWMWCCFQSFLNCLVQPNQVIHFLFHINFIIRMKLWTFKQSTCALYASEILLFKLSIYAREVTRDMLIDWSFFLGVLDSVNSLSVSATDSTLSWPLIQWIYL